MRASSSRPARRGTLSAADYRALASFRYAMRRYLAFSEAGARSVGLTSQQHQALLAIKAHSLTRPMSIRDLSNELLLRHHSTVELVGRMEKAGFTQKTVNAEDRRRAVISLTAKGEGVLAALSTNNLRELRLIAPAFTGLLGQLEKLDGE